MPEVVPLLVGVAIDAAFGAGVAATTIVGGLTVGAVVTDALVIGAAIGAAALVHKGRPQQAASGWQPQIPISIDVAAQSVGPLFFLFGEERVGGVYHYRAIAGGHLLFGMVINCESVAQLVAHFVDDELAVVHGIDFAPFIAADNIVVQPTSGIKIAQTISTVWYGGQWVQIPGPWVPVAAYEFRNGSPSGAVSALLSTYAPDQWTADFKCIDLACAYSAYVGQSISLTQNLYNFMGAFPNRVPKESFVARGLLYDPRDVTQSFNDRTTWKFSKNPALIWAWYWTHNYGGRLPFAMIDWQSVKDAANYCDRLVPAYGGGTEPYAECHGQWNTGEAIGDVIKKILASCDGIQFEHNGKVAIWILQDVTPTITLTSADFSSVSWDESAGALAEFNYLQPAYVEPRINYASLSTAPLTDDASIALVGERASTLQLDYVKRANQAYRLGHRTMRRVNPPKIVRGVVLPSGMRAVGEFAVAINAPECGVVGTFMPTKLFDIPASGASAGIEFHEIAADAFADVVMPDDPVSPGLGGAPGGVVTAVLSPTGIPHAISWDSATPPNPTIAAQARTYQVVNGTPINPLSLPAQGLPIDNSLRFVAQARPVNPTTHAPLGDGTWTPTGDSAPIWDDYVDQWDLASPSGSIAPSTTYELRAWFVSTVSNTVGAPLAGVFVDVPAGP